MQHPHRYQHFALDANDNLVDIRNTVAMNGNCISVRIATRK